MRSPRWPQGYRAPGTTKIAVVAVGVVEAAIETRGLRRVFKTRKQIVEAVAGGDLTVPTGGVFRVLGPDRARQNTPPPLLATLLPATGGKVAVAGADLLATPEPVR